MTKPVAYLVNGVAFNDIDRAKFYSDVLKYHKKIDIESLVPIPLYTAEQLHPRVKMTRAEFESFQLLFEAHDDLSAAFNYIGNYDCYEVLYDRLFTGTDTDREKQNEFAALWANYKTTEPEETIEIVPDMKWFVRSKEKDDGVYYVLGDISKYYSETTTAENDDEIADFGHRFDTEEEAKLWTNPITEAVRLPVEGGND